jgi:hypothetical protein
MNLIKKKLAVNQIRRRHIVFILFPEIVIMVAKITTNATVKC